MKRLPTSLLLIALLGVPAYAQELLPSTFGAWTASGNLMHVPAGQIAQLAGDRAKILQEYGVSSGQRRDYTQGSGSVSVTLYSMTDPTAAYGAFTYLADPNASPVNAGRAAAYASGTGSRAWLVVGNFLLDANCSGTRPGNQDLQALANSVAAHADHRPFPDIPQALPQVGLEPGSVRYVLGPQALAEVFTTPAGTPQDWIGFDKSAEAVVARYRVEGEKPEEATVLLVVYPTQQIASDEYDRLGKWFTVNPEPGQATPKPAIFENRSSALLAIISGVDSRVVANKIFDKVHYASAVTWNEPTHSFTDPSISSIILGAFFGTGSIMVLAVAAGLGFGGIRLLVKLLFPGKVFDRNERVEILQLGLSSKPINAGDFYR
jgi:hypothetical protein